MKYVVIGTTKVAGRTYGEQLSEEDLANVNIHALLVGGHIKPATTTSKKADEADTESEAV